MTTQDILELAARCEEWAAESIAYALKQKASRDMATPAIDRALAHLERAAALKARAHTKGEE